MSKGVNKVILLGFMGTDPEIRHMPNGTAVASFSLATSETWKDKSGERQERTEWHKVKAFGKLAEIIGEYAAKGTQAYCEGAIRTNKWQDREGNDRYTTEIVISTFQMIGGRTEGGGSERGRAPDVRAHREAPSEESWDDDIPF